MKRNPLLVSLVSLGLVLAACGGDSDGSTADPPATIDTVDDASDDGSDDGLRAPTPIEAVSGTANGSASGAATQSAPAIESGEIATSDMMIAPFVSEYVVSGDLPALPVDDTGYVFDGSVEVTAGDAGRLAAAFGVDGEPERDGERFGAWIVGPTDGSAPSVWLYDDAQGSWSYNAPWSDGGLVEPCAVSIDSEGNEFSDCPEPTPPTGVPTAEEAESRAREMLAALGLDPDTLTFETFADEWSANVTADDRTADRQAIRYWNFGFGAEGVLQWAGGSLAVPEPVGPYPLVDLDTALERLRDQGGFGVPMPLLDGPAVEETDAATSGLAPQTEPAVAADPAESADPAEPGEPLETIVIDEPLPVDPGNIEPVTVTLVDVQPDLWWVWDAEDNVWLVPAYRFIDTDGGWHTVPAVTEEFLMQSDQPVDGPIPVEPDGGIGDGAEPLPPPESLPVESLPVEPDEEPIDARPIDDPEVALSVLEAFVGLSLEEFSAEAKALGYSTRVAVQDGEALALTADFSETRVNVAVEGPRVVALESIG